MSLLALDRAAVSYQCFAPDVRQAHVVNHLTGEEMGESRNVMVEAARIARGNLKPLSEAKVDEFDLVLLPGGFGAAKNLCNFAFDAENLEALPELVEFLKAAHAAGLPIGFACIAPAIAARVFGEEGLSFTIGDDAGTASALSKWGARHEARSVTEVVVDEKLKIVTTPAYMFGDARISEVAAGLENWVKATVALS
ncbi:DJ-1/PfpI family [Verrucomicrobiia bacterium DG1235]|nr:DJ-1/PfpI family [Verrucomicrobiae bacterium DG1235]